MKISYEKIILYIAIIVLVFLLYKQCNKTSTESEQIILIDALNDSLKISKHNDSTQTATITTLKTESVNDFTRLVTKNIEIENLQTQVKEYKNKLKAGSSVSTGNIETIIHHEDTTLITKSDTVYISTGVDSNSFVYIYPEYSDSLVNKWITYHSKMNRFKSVFDLKINNDFSVIVGSYKNKPFADLITENPYSSTKSFRTYQVSMPKVKRWGIGPYIGVGLTSDFKIKPSGGLSIQYAIIRL